MRRKSQNRTCVIILGMHRSGTSCLVGTLQTYGLFLGEVFDRNKFNLKGNRENKSIVNLNNTILKVSGGNWHNPPGNIEWEKKHKRKRDKIINNLISSSKNSIIGFKDPRTVFTLPFWTEGLPNVKLVGTFRNPTCVVESLKSRHSESKNQTIDYHEIWKKYNKKLLEYLGIKNFPIIPFDIEKDEYMNSIKRIIKYLGLYSPDVIEPPPFYDGTLINFKPYDDKESISNESKQILENLWQIYRQQTHFF